MRDQTRRHKEFRQQVRPLLTRLLGAARRQAGGSAFAEDWLQETFLRAWRDYDQLKEEQSLYAWLLKILDRVIAEDIRRESRRNRLAPLVNVDDEFFNSHPAAQPGPFEKTVTEQAESQINQAIDELPDEYRKAVLLRDIEELSYREIAYILDLPQGTVMSRLSRGRRLLAQRLIRVGVQDGCAVQLQKGE